MSESIDFQPYLHAIRQEYEKWWEVYTVTDAEGRECRKAIEKPASPFDFGLMVQTVTRDEPQTPNPENPEEPKEKIERFPVLEGLRKYAFDEKTRQLLLVGRPGSGKSTALVRLLLEEATLTPNASLNIGRRELKAIPVLVELRYWQGSIVALMLEFFRRHGLNLSEAELKNLLDAKRVLVLMDGVNELPSEDARSQLAAFRRKYERVPAIFTTRDLSLGGDVGIEKKLEMQPLTEAQMQAFVRAYLPECGEAMWQQLQGRLREFGKTPLLLWMLCEVVKQSPNAQLPSNLGGIFQVFARSYEVSSVRKHEVAALKGDVRPLSDRRLWGKALKHLAEGMMCGEKPVDFRVVIERSEAERELEKLFEKEPSPPKTARDCLDDLLKYHLLQIKAGNEIEFRHQLIQEYYAAEALLARLPQMSDRELKREYLNYLKWTEPVALMLALVEEAQAVRVVRLALEVDWMLGARLAGEVKREWQEQTVEMVSGLDVPLWLKVELWGKGRSDFAIPNLLRALKDEDFNVRMRAAEVLGKLGSEAAIPGLLQAFNDKDFRIRERAIDLLGNLGYQKAIVSVVHALEYKYADVRRRAVDVLEILVSEEAIPALLKVLENEDSGVEERVVAALEILGSDTAIVGLLQVLEDECSGICERAVEVLINLGLEVAILVFLLALEDEDFSVRGSKAALLGSPSSRAVIRMRLLALEDEDEDDEDEAYCFMIGGCMVEDTVKVLGNLNSKEEIWERLKALEEDDYFSFCEREVAVLGNLSLFQVLEYEDSGVHRSVTEVVRQPVSQRKIPGLLQPFEEQDFWVPKSQVRTLEILSSEVVIPSSLQASLLQDLEHENSYVRGNAAEALGNFKDDRAAHILPKLRELIRTESGEDAFRALTAIQANCKFYNYDIFRSPPLPKPETEHPPGQTTNIFNIDTLTASNSPLNLGGTVGNQTSTQNPKPEP